MSDVLHGLVNAMDKASAVSVTKVAKLLELERTKATSQAEELYKRILAVMDKAAQVSEPFLSNPDLELAVHYQADELDTASIMAKVSSTSAEQFKASWMAFANAKQVETEFVNSFARVPKFGFINPVIDEVSKKYEHAETIYERCRDRVCELSAVRTLARDLPAASRPQAVQGTLKTIAVLQGQLDPRLSLLMQAAAEQKK